jgi:hypothetical protein
MGLISSLLVVFLLFCLLMAGVLAFCLRERRKIDGIGNPAKRDAYTGDIRPQDHVVSPNDAEQDSRVAIVLFGSIIVGALLALITAYLVFGRKW